CSGSAALLKRNTRSPGTRTLPKYSRPDESPVAAMRPPQPAARSHAVSASEAAVTSQAGARTARILAPCEAQESCGRLRPRYEHSARHEQMARALDAGAAPAALRSRIGRALRAPPARPRL